MEENNIHSFPGFAKGLRPSLERDSLKFGTFLTILPSAPLVDLIPNYMYPMDGNDKVGCCVVAGFDHFRQVVTGLLTGSSKNFTQDKIWNFYKTQNPNFDPNGTADTNGPGSSSDNGMNIQLFLEYLQANKYILGFAKIDHTNEQELKAAIYLGLGVITGVTVDQAQMTQFASGTWDFAPNSPIDGGHCIPLAGYTGNPDNVSCVTWGKVVQCTQNFIQKQMNEAWFVLMQEHVDHPNFRNHFDLKGFAQAVSAITNGKINIPIKMKPQHTFVYNLSVGMIGPDTLALQQCLNFDPDTQIATTGAGSPGQETSLFGMLTLTAVKKFQHKYSIPETGFVGPLTREKLNILFGLPYTLKQSIVQVESDGYINAIGDNGQAFGIFQIWQSYMDDALPGHKAQECLNDPVLSEKAFDNYMARYATPQQLGRPVTSEDIARINNGGPQGWNNPATLGYWQKVLKYYKGN